MKRIKKKKGHLLWPRKPDRIERMWGRLMWILAWNRMGGVKIFVEPGKDAEVYKEQQSKDKGK